MGAGHAAVVIRSARARAGLSQRGLAERAGVAQPTIARYESGAVEPSFAAVDALVAACGFELRTVLAEPDEGDRAAIAIAAELTPQERLQAVAAWEPLRGVALREGS